MSTKEALAEVTTLFRRFRGVRSRARNQRLIVQVEHRPAGSIIHMEGRLTFEEAAKVHKGLEQAWRVQPRRMVVNLENCSYADSAGIAMLVSAMKLAWFEGVGFYLVGLQSQVRNVLEMNRLATRFETHATIEEALAK